MTSDRPDRQALREQLMALLREFLPDPECDLEDDTPLITSSLVESTTLLNVALWVEDHIDSTVEISAFDLAREWDTISDILNFVAKHQGPPPPAGAPRSDRKL